MNLDKYPCFEVIETYFKTICIISFLSFLTTLQRLNFHVRATPKSGSRLLHNHQIKQEEQRLNAKRWQNLGLVFPNREGFHQSPHNLNYGFKRFLKQIGVADAHFHATRHGHATHLLESGIYAGVVQERLGHSNVSFTMQFYGHVTPKMQQQAIAILDHQFGTGKKETLISRLAKCIPAHFWGQIWGQWIMKGRECQL